MQCYKMLWCVLESCILGSYCHIVIQWYPLYHTLTSTICPSEAASEKLIIITHSTLLTIWFIVQLIYTCETCPYTNALDGTPYNLIVKRLDPLITDIYWRLHVEYWVIKHFCGHGHSLRDVSEVESLGGENKDFAEFD